MANELYLYPFATYGGTAIPLDVVAPLNSFTLQSGDASYNSGLAAGSPLSVFSAKAMRVVTAETIIGVSMLAPSLLNSFWLPANYIMTFVVAGPYIRCALLDNSDGEAILYCTALASWQSLGKETRYESQ